MRRAQNPHGDAGSGVGVGVRFILGCTHQLNGGGKMNAPQVTSTPTKIDSAISTAERISERLQAILDRLPADLSPAQQVAWFSGVAQQAVKL